MEPVLGGGEMIREVCLDGATWNDIPWKFEAGTPNIAGVVAFRQRRSTTSSGWGSRALHAHEVELTRYALAAPGRSTALPAMFGPPSRSNAPASWPSTTRRPPARPRTVLDSYGVAVRAGHHCAQPLMRRLGVVATARASFSLL